jgi:hypothetical protein
MLSMAMKSSALLSSNIINVQSFRAMSWDTDEPPVHGGEAFYHVKHCVSSHQLKKNRKKKEVTIM